MKTAEARNKIIEAVKGFDEDKFDWFEAEAKIDTIIDEVSRERAIEFAKYCGVLRINPLLRDVALNEKFDGWLEQKHK